MTSVNMLNKLICKEGLHKIYEILNNYEILNGYK